MSLLVALHTAQGRALTFRCERVNSPAGWFALEHPAGAILINPAHAVALDCQRFDPATLPPGGQPALRVVSPEDDSPPPAPRAA